MNAKLIPFRLGTHLSELTCPDGEIAVLSNLEPILQGDSALFSGGSDISSVSPISQGFSLQLPEAPAVEFALRRTVLPGWHIHPDSLPSITMSAGDPTEKGWGVKAMSVLSELCDDMLRENLFLEPFLILCALRLKDGSRILPSSPVLMIPNSGPPAVEGDTAFSADTMEMKVAAAVCRLQWRINMPALTKLHDDVSHLDILISEPLQLYDRKGGMTADHRFSCPNFTHSIATDGSSGERPVTGKTIVQGWRPEATDSSVLARNLLATTEFHLISEIEFHNLSSSTEFSDVEFNCGGLRMLEATPGYTPSFAHHSQVTASSSSIISGRVTISDITLIHPLPSPTALSAPYSTDSGYRPRWVFHPNPHAGIFPYESDGDARKLSLRKHPSFYGAYFWRGLEANDNDDPVITEYTDISVESRTVRHPAMVWRSGIGQPLDFPDCLMMTLTVGRVFALCRAFRASGLVATTSPTAYAFTDKGIFLLKEMTDGTFRDAGLISAHRLGDATSVSMTGRTVTFTTDNGEMLVIDGTKIKTPSELSSASSSQSGGIAFRSSDPDAECLLRTKALKLGNAALAKRLSGVTLLGEFDNRQTSMQLHGSDSLREWRLLARSNASGVLPLLHTPAFRFFRLTLKTRSPVSLQGLLITISP